MTNCGFGTWTAPHPLRKQGRKMKKIKLAITSFCDKTLFKPTASASTGSGGPCNEHRQKAKSCVLNYEILILMFHCFTLTISRINTSNALCFSDTQWQKLWQWWGSKMSLNHVEPCWTLPLRNTTFDCLERPCSNTAPASATSAPGDASNSATCRKKESAWRIRRYCNAKTWHFAMTMHCINACHLFRVVFFKFVLMRMKLPPHGTGCTGTRPLWDPIMTDPNKIFLKSTLSPPPPWSQVSLLLATHQSAQWPPASPIPACPPSVDPSSSCPPPPVRPGVAAAAPGFCHQPSSIPGAAGHPASVRWRGISCRTPTPPWLNPWQRFSWSDVNNQLSQGVSRRLRTMMDNVMNLSP